MSQRFKPPTAIDVRDRRLNRMAAMLPDQAALDLLLEGSDPLTRQAMVERLAPYLRFAPQEILEHRQDLSDCMCGFRRGSIIPHECLK